MAQTSPRSVQVIYHEGQPQWAVVPYAEYQALLARLGETAQPLPPATLAESQANEDLAAATGGNADPGNAWWGPALAERRAAAQLSAAELARAAGISPHYLAQIEAGEREPNGAIQRAFRQALAGQE